MEQVPARLVVKRGPTLHREFALTQSATTLGRGTDNVIVLADQEVSRRHARITWGDAVYVIEDIGSTNGTFVNGQRVNGRIPLQNGMEVALGEAVVLIFEDGSTQGPAAATAAHDTGPILDPVPQTAAPTMPPFADDDAAAWEDLGQPPAPSRSMRRSLLGCGCLIFVIIFLCAATLFFLDAYQQGRLLYCGPLRPFFENLLGTFGFAPNCL